MMVNGRKLTDVTVAQAEQIIEEVYQNAQVNINASMHINNILHKCGGASQN